MKDYNLYLLEVKDSNVIGYKKINHLPTGEDLRLLNGFGGFLYKHDTKNKLITWIININHEPTDISIKLNSVLVEMFNNYKKTIKRDLKLNHLLK
jgi:hypothetical protein